MNRIMVPTLGRASSEVPGILSGSATTEGRFTFQQRNSGAWDGPRARKGARPSPRPVDQLEISAYSVSSLMVPLKLSREMRGPPEPVLKLNSLPGVYLLVRVASGPIWFVIFPEKVLSS